jgi:hypothetical protein
LELHSKVVITINGYDYTTYEGRNESVPTQEIQISMYNLNRVISDNLLDFQPPEINESFDLIGLKFDIHSENGVIKRQRM